MLGPLQVGEDLNLEPRDRMALGVLSVHRHRDVSAEQLADALWQGSAPASWAKQVQICISRLRKSLGPHTISTTSAGYRLDIDSVEVDADRFEHLITRGHTYAADDQPDRAATSFARALELWRGEPFPELDEWPTAQIEAARLHELRLSAQEDWLTARLAAGEHRRVSAEAAALAAEEPLREGRWAILALALYRMGRQADALRAIANARKLLREELGIDPGPELVELENAILRQDEALNAPALLQSVSAFCPYKGLAPYELRDADQFFGRDDEVAHLLNRLTASALLVLAGPSGSGKSSLARAGLAPALEARGGDVAICVPGRDPGFAWSEATGSAKAGSIIIVDQFEEMFALDVAADAIRSFCLDLVARAQDVAPVILVVRSDFLGQLAISPQLSRLAEQGLHLVAPLAGDTLRTAIEQPAANAGLRLEHGLLELLERDTDGEPGAMPLLSHALTETWHRRDGNVLTVEGYRASGGIRGAVAHSADRLYDSLPDTQRTVLRSLLLRMVSPTIDGPPVRCRVPMRNVLGDPDRDRVVALLVRSRLVTAEEDAYELAHEALARAWPRLRAWLDEDTEGQRIMRHVAARAEDWDAMGRPDSELYRGARLEALREWRHEADGDLTPIEEDFVAASIALAEAESSELEARARRDARQNARLKRLLGVAAAALVMALIGGYLAVRSRGSAIESRDDARNEVLVNQSLGLRPVNRSAAALLAVEAYRRNPGPGSMSALLGTFVASPGFLGYRYLDDARWLNGDAIPNSRAAVVALDGERIRTVDLETGEMASPFDASGMGTTWDSQISVSADGSRVAVYSAHETDLPCFEFDSLMERDDEGCAVLSVFDVGTGKAVMEPVSPPIGRDHVTMNGDGSLVAVTGGFDGDLAVYDVATAELVGRLDGLPRPEGRSVWRNAAVTFGPDGMLYLGSMAGPIRAIHTDTMEVVETFDSPEFSSNNFLVVTDDERLVAAGTEAVVAFDLDDGSASFAIDLREGRNPEPCPWFAVNPARDEMYCGDFNGVIEVRSLRTGDRTGAVLDPQLGSVGQLLVLDDGDELAALGNGSPTISAWRLDGGGLVTTPVAAGQVAYDGYDTGGNRLLVARGGPLLANWDDLSDFAIWDPVHDVEISRLPSPAIGVGWLGPDHLGGFDPVEETTFVLDAATMLPIDQSGASSPTTPENVFTSAGGEYLYMTFSGGEVWRLDPATYTRIEPTTKIVGHPFSASATRHGERLVVSGLDDGPRIDLYDGKTGEHLAGPVDGAVWSSVSLDGTVVGAEGGTITEFDPETLEPLGVFAGARGEVNTLQFSDDGSMLLAGANDQTVSLFDVDTRQRIGDPIATLSPLSSPGFLRPDGKELAVNQRGAVVLWNIDPQYLAGAACRLAGRNLTELEWNTLLGDIGPYRATCSQY
ncbi:MAG TPA: BTAD domain-containing putative transcriptional regulator [Ilumatobacteraceae bacterium]|nr:BTAD domain-containing putative transcriptional regulator [Ilumatobacteraceae bacterium]